tara:strand:+ start:409 stop:516 length:108 start_codon:yes stop_codon:yes gene_type:complete
MLGDSEANSDWFDNKIKQNEASAMRVCKGMTRSGE